MEMLETSVIGVCSGGNENAALRAAVGRAVLSDLLPGPGMLRQFLRDESGIAVTEYGLLLALIAILLVGVITIFGSQIASWWANKTNQITSV